MEVILGKGLRTKNLGVNTSLPEHIQQQTEEKRKYSQPGSSMNFNSRNNNNIQEQAFRTQVNSKNNLGKTARIVLLAQETQTTRRQCKPNPPAAVTAPRLSRLKLVTVHMQV